MEKYNFKDNSDLKNNTAENLFDDSDIQACSATDCTGLIPALPETDAELEHYQELYHYLPDSPDQKDVATMQTGRRQSHSDQSTRAAPVFFLRMVRFSLLRR